MTPERLAEIRRQVALLEREQGRYGVKHGIELFGPVLTMGRDLLAEVDRLREALTDVRGYVRTGGPLYNAARLELIGIVNDALDGKQAPS